MPYQRRYYIFGVALCILTTAASQEVYGLGPALTPESLALIEAARQLRCTVSMDRETYFTGETAAIRIVIQNPTSVPIRIFHPLVPGGIKLIMREQKGTDSRPL